jgi:hypothetical protein
MRPNIDISHTLNGRVRDLAEELDCTVAEAYQQVIKRGVDELEDEIEASA